MSYQKFTYTARFVQEKFAQANDLDDVVFIKDFKPANNEYFGSNVDVLCLSQSTATKLKKFLESFEFRKELISFEYDKAMYYPPKHDENLTKVHIYPHMSWYSVKFNFWKGELSDYLSDYRGFKVIEPRLEVPLLVFHAYFEDRLLRDYDVTQIQAHVKENNFQVDDFESVLEPSYFELFKKLLPEILETNSSDEVEYTDFSNQIKFVFSTDNKIRHKLYYLKIHVAKKLRIIRG